MIVEYDSDIMEYTENRKELIDDSIDNLNRYDDDEYLSEEDIEFLTDLPDSKTQIYSTSLIYSDNTIDDLQQHTYFNSIKNDNIFEENELEFLLNIPEDNNLYINDEINNYNDHDHAYIGDKDKLSEFSFLSERNHLKLYSKRSNMQQQQ